MLQQPGDRDTSTTLLRCLHNTAGGTFKYLESTPVGKNATAPSGTSVPLVICQDLRIFCLFPLLAVCFVFNELRFWTGRSSPDVYAVTRARLQPKRTEGLISLINDSRRFISCRRLVNLCLCIDVLSSPARRAEQESTRKIGRRIC